jgi:hypothetical protein
LLFFKVSCSISPINVFMAKVYACLEKTGKI